MKDTNTKNQRLLTEVQTAEYLGISKHTLRQQRHTGPIGGEGRIPFVPYLKLGRNIRYDIRDLDHWIKQIRVSNK